MLLRPHSKPHLRKTPSGWLCTLYFSASLPHYSRTTSGRTPAEAYWRLQLTQPLLQNAGLSPKTP